MTAIFPLLLDASIKSALILAAAAVFCFAARRRSAALRHLVGTLALVGVLILPLLTAALPAWRVDLPRRAATVRERATTATIAETSALASPRPNSNETLPTRVDTPEAASEARSLTVAARSQALARAAARPDWRRWLVTFYLLGVGILLARLIAGRLAVRRLVRSARPISDGPWMEALAQVRTAGVRVRLLESPDLPVPATCGIFRPVILLPAGGYGEIAKWRSGQVPETSPDRHITTSPLRYILLHELAHIRRRDGLWQLVSQLACAAYWFNPLVWLLDRQVSLDRERACDDAVLTADAQTHPTDYAQALLEVAQHLHRALIPQGVIPMARTSQLEPRVRSVLDISRSRRGLTTFARVVIPIAFAALLLPIAVLGAGDEEPASERAFVATAPGAGNVELLGIARYPLDGSKWWRPDGQELPKAPLEHWMGDRVGLEGDAYLFAVRLDDHGTDPGINFVIPGAVRTAPTQTLLNDRGLAELVTVACVIPGGPEATAFKVALSQGAWQSVDLPVLEGAHWGADTLGILHEDKPVLCKAEQVAEGLELTVVRHHLLTSEYDTRIVVVDRDGRERTPTKISSSGHQGLSLTTALFRGVAKADVKHAVLKYRPWNVVEFHNVSLKPGVKTEVQIVMPEAHAAAEPAHAAPEGRTGFGFPGGGGAPGGTPGVRRGGGFPGALPGLGGFGPPPEGAADVPKGAAALDAYPHKVMFISTGLTHFEPGDRIEITEVRGRKATLEQGGTYLIKGRYTLASRDEAVVGVSIATATDPREGRTIVHPGQQTKVQRGSGEFALVKTVETSGGWPHVSFSPAEGGSSFGNIYFGHGPEGLWLFPVLLEDPWVIRDAKASARAAEPGAVNSEKLPLAHQPPVVVKTSPEAGDQEVDPSITEIRVTYSKRMMDKSWSWSTDTGLGEFPEIDGQIRYLEDGRTCVMPVKLKPGTTYAIRLNSAKFHNFKDAENRPAVPYLLTFKTRN